MSETAKSAAVARIERPEDMLPAVQSETAAVLSMIERLAKDPTVDIDRVERMMVLHREMRMEKAREEFNRAMAGVQTRLPQVKRDATNKHTRSQYARLETIAAAVDPIIAEAGLSLSYGTEKSDLPNHYKVVCTVCLGAFERRYELDTPSDGTGSGGNATKTAVQAMGSALSYARRYLKLMIFDIALTNEDNDGNRVEGDHHQSDRQSESEVKQPQVKQKDVDRITPDKAQKLRNLLRDIGKTDAAFCQAAGIKDIDRIWAIDFDDCMTFAGQMGRQN